MDKKEERPYGVYTDLNYKVLENTAKTLAINVSASFGKHNTNETVHYLFDLSTGYRVELDTLIDMPKRKVFAQFLYQKKNNIISDFLKEVKDSIEVYKQRNDTVNYERSLYQIDAYTDCIERHNSNDVNLKYIHYSYKEGKFYFKLEQCFIWAANSYDDLGDFDFEFTISELEPYLSTYALRLFRN